MVHGQCRGDSEKDHVAEALMEVVKCQFYTAKLQDFLRVAEANAEAAIWQHRVKEAALQVLITSWSLCIQIAIRIAGNRDAVGALQSEEVQLCASRLASYLQAYPNEHATTISVVLAGLGLPQRKLSERKSSSSGLLTVRFAMDRKETRAKGAFMASKCICHVLEVSKNLDIERHPSFWVV